MSRPPCPVFTLSPRVFSPRRPPSPLPTPRKSTARVTHPPSLHAVHVLGLRPVQGQDPVPAGDGPHQAAAQQEAGPGARERGKGVVTRVRGGGEGGKRVSIPTPPPSPPHPVSSKSSAARSPTCWPPAKASLPPSGSRPSCVRRPCCTRSTCWSCISSCWPCGRPSSQKSTPPPRT